VGCCVCGVVTLRPGTGIPVVGIGVRAVHQGCCLGGWGVVAIVLVGGSMRWLVVEESLEEVVVAV
jgi:hypothetical protein